MKKRTEGKPKKCDNDFKSTACIKKATACVRNGGGICYSCKVEGIKKIMR